jgi:hypothetical protein
MKQQLFDHGTPVSRRLVIKGLASMALAIGGVGCASPGSPSSVASHTLGTVVYSYQGHTQQAL